MTTDGLTSLVWEVDDVPSRDALRVVDEGLGQFNEASAPLSDVRPLACFARLANGTVVGGAVGRSWGECCELQQLWVLPQCRRRGTGRELVRRFEQRALALGCRTVYLETFSFQAPGLYQGLGYTALAQIDGFPQGISKLIMVRRLEAALASTTVGPPVA